MVVHFTSDLGVKCTQYMNTVCRSLIILYPYLKPQILIDKINCYKRLEGDVELKFKQISSLKLDASSVEAVTQLKGKLKNTHQLTGKLKDTHQEKYRSDI
jgi:hypothetical protein